MSLAISIAIILFIVAFILLILPQYKDQHLLEPWQLKRQFTATKHKWEKSKQRGFYFCNLCTKLMSGFWSNMLECRKCGIIIHQYCRYLKLKKPECKFIISSLNNKGNGSIHQWRQGIHSINSICSYCELICTGLQVYKCLWCQRMKHPTCKSEQICDFGSLKEMILPPNDIFCQQIGKAEDLFISIKTKQRKQKLKTSDSNSDLDKDSINKFMFKSNNITPVIVLVNSKSGGQAGADYLKSFYQLLNPLQVISILEEGLDRLKIFKDLKNMKLVVAGGDGTICSVLNYLTSGIIEQWIENNPPVAILPLGTGNDLSRSMGWGTGEEDKDARFYLEQLKQSRVMQLDRWSMRIYNQQNIVEKQFTVYNYLGIGLDAKVCLDFHHLRQKYPQLFISQFSNKILYAQMGAIDLLNGKMDQLNVVMSVEVDGTQIDLHGLENLVLLNIKHWAGGASDLWKQNREFRRQSFNDGMIEVLGVADMLHLGQVQIGMDLPLQLAQGKNVKIESKKEFKGKVAFQIDGQPFELQAPFKVEFQYKDKVKMSVIKNTHMDERLEKVLNCGLKEGILTQHQYNYIADRMGSVE